jgi:hypothetical protein
MRGASQPPLRELGVNILEHARLWQCIECKSKWIENEREAHVISEQEVEETFGWQFEGPGA